MAKRKKRYKQKIKSRRERDVSNISKISDLFHSPFQKNYRFRHDNEKISIQDKRYFAPYRENYDIDGRGVTYTITPPTTPKRNRRDFTRDPVSFKYPKTVTVCRRRRERREILFRSGKVGKGKRISSVRRYTDDSKIKC